MDYCRILRGSSVLHFVPSNPFGCVGDANGEESMSYRLARAGSFLIHVLGLPLYRHCDRTIYRHHAAADENATRFPKAILSRHSDEHRRCVPTLD